MELIQEFRDIVRAFNSARIPYAVCGGLALAMHGFTRATQDIDLLIDPSVFEQARDVLKDLGYQRDSGWIPIKGGQGRLFRVWKADPDMGDLLVVDLLFADDDMSDIVERRVRVDFDDGPVWVVSKSDLVRMKRWRNSKQDQADIDSLEKGKDES